MTDVRREGWRHDAQMLRDAAAAGATLDPRTLRQLADRLDATEAVVAASYAAMAKDRARLDKRPDRDEALRLCAEFLRRWS